jgi:hypothetical protein
MVSKRGAANAIPCSSEQFVIYVTAKRESNHAHRLQRFFYRTFQEKEKKL